MYRYNKRFLRLVDNNIPKEKKILMLPFKQMIEERKTVSDEILNFAKKEGYEREETIPNRLAAEIALLHSKRFLNEIESTRRIIDKLD
jgi:hypothetical protein